MPCLSNKTGRIKGISISLYVLCDHLLRSSPSDFWYISLLLLAFAQPITVLDDGLGIVIRVIYFHKDESSWNNLSSGLDSPAFGAQQVFLFELSASLRFISFYSRHFSPGIFHSSGFLMFCRGSTVSCKCYVTPMDFF